MGLDLKMGQRELGSGGLSEWGGESYRNTVIVLWVLMFKTLLTTYRTV